tara:strand:- start:830 stop:1684 length:855 start_codon:yes stop_codon:yes gene_type:complete
MYDNRYTRSHPGLQIALLDYSYSMIDPIVQATDGSEALTKIDAAAWIIDHWLYELVEACGGGESGEFKQYLDLAVLKFDDKISSGFNSIPIGELPTTVEKVNAAGKFEETNVTRDGQSDTLLKWIDTDKELGGQTKMCAALQSAEDMIKNWIPNKEESFPPVVLNVTDGQANDCGPDELIKLCDRIKAEKTDNGNALLGCLHVTSEEINPILFPTSEQYVRENCKDPFAILLFHMASTIPDELVERAKKYGLPVENGSKFFIYGSNFANAGKFFRFGTNPTDPD